MKKRKFRLPMIAKTIILIVVFATVLMEVAMAFFSIQDSRKNQKTYKQIANNLAGTVAKVVDVPKYSIVQGQIASILDDPNITPVDNSHWGSDEWNAYLDNFLPVSNSQEFKDLKAFLQDMLSVNSKEINCFYLSYVDVKREFCVYVVDSAEGEDECRPGSIDQLLPKNRKILANPEVGFDAYITNQDYYGWLVTAGSPLFNEDGDVVGYAMVDVDMTIVRRAQATNIVHLFFWLLAGVILISAIGIIVVHFVFTRPIRILNDVANSYDKKDPEGTHERFSNLHIRTHDEIAELAVSVKKLEDDVYNQIKEITLVNKELVASQKETKKMTELASKDGLTGVQNKVAYNHEIAKINKAIEEGNMIPFGIAMVDLNWLKNMNDEFGHDTGDEAIIKLANIICNIFDHSPVYRTGGDEFVIILRKVDFANAQDLIDQFNKELQEAFVDESLEEHLRISAAIGYSEYIKEEDKSVDDVFRRADKAMYKRKWEMKVDADNKNNVGD